MQEAADLACEGFVHVVDEGIEEAGLSVEGNDVVVCYDSRDEGAVALAEDDLVSSAADDDPAVALDAHGDIETVVFQQVTVEGVRDFHHAHIKVW